LTIEIIISVNFALKSIPVLKFDQFKSSRSNDVALRGRIVIKSPKFDLKFLNALRQFNLRLGRFHLDFRFNLSSFFVFGTHWLLAILLIVLTRFWIFPA